VGEAPKVLDAGIASEAALALWRADAQLRISADLAKQIEESGPSAALALAQEGFELYQLHASNALALGADRIRSSGLPGQSLTSWLEDLQEKNRSLNVQRRNSKAEDSAFAFQFSEFERGGGTPMSYHALPGVGPLKLHLTTQESQQTRQALAVSGEWLGSLIVVCVLAFLPLLPARLRLFWPEQFALLGLVGWHLAGLTSIVGGLLLIAMCGRIVILIRGLQTLVLKRSVQPSTTTAAAQNGNQPAM
jgi:hypothetical protein